MARVTKADNTQHSRADSHSAPWLLSSGVKVGFLWSPRSRAQASPGLWVQPAHFPLAAWESIPACARAKLSLEPAWPVLSSCCRWVQNPHPHIWVSPWGETIPHSCAHLVLVLGGWTPRWNHTPYCPIGFGVTALWKASSQVSSLALLSGPLSYSCFPWHQKGPETRGQEFVFAISAVSWDPSGHLFPPPLWCPARFPLCCSKAKLQGASSRALGCGPAKPLLIPEMHFLSVQVVKWQFSLYELQCVIKSAVC